MATMVECKCANRSCGATFIARTADRKRGWARFCSKSCKAVQQERRTGQHAMRQRVMDANGGKTPGDFAREFGGIPQFDRHGRYEGFLAGGFDNTAHQNDED